MQAKQRDRETEKMMAIKIDQTAAVPQQASRFVSPVRIPSVIVALLCGLMLISLAGCRLCDNSEDFAYPTYGGAWQRTVRDSGRVGSVFDPAGARSSTLVGRDTTEPVDEQLRRLRGTNEEEKKERPENMFRDEDEDEDEDTDTDGAEDLPPPRESLEDGSLEDGEDPKLEEEKRKLREESFESIKVIEGEPLPPLLR